MHHSHFAKDVFDSPLFKKGCQRIEESIGKQNLVP
jgi:hypothetical protein